MEVKFIDWIRQQKDTKGLYGLRFGSDGLAHNSASDDFVPLLAGRLERHRWRFLLGGTQDWLYPSENDDALPIQYLLAKVNR